LAGRAICGTREKLKENSKLLTLQQAVDYSKYMVKKRFNEICSYIPFLFADNSKKGEDPWPQIMMEIDGFNKNRKNTVVASSFLKVLDESMLAFRPQARKSSLV
jgi:hypothetical protein